MSWGAVILVTILVLGGIALLFRLATADRAAPIGGAAPIPVGGAANRPAPQAQQGGGGWVVGVVIAAVVLLVVIGLGYLVYTGALLGWLRPHPGATSAADVASGIEVPLQGAKISFVAGPEGSAWYKTPPPTTRPGYRTQLCQSVQVGHTFRLRINHDTSRTYRWEDLSGIVVMTQQLVPDAVVQMNVWAVEVKESDPDPCN